MELDSFIEKDIIEFLDRKSAELTDRAESLREEEFSLYEITEDYLKEIDDALTIGNINKAQEIFEEVKHKYESSAEGSVSRKRLYTILEEVYEKIKDYQEGSGGKKKLFETVREYEQKGLFTNPEIFKLKEEEATGLILSSIKAKEREIEDLLIKDRPSAKEIGLAVNKYQELKLFIKKIPKNNLDLLSKVTSKAISIYEDINEAKNKLVEYSKQTPEDELAFTNSNLSVEEKLSQVRLIKEKLVQLHNNIDKYINRRDLKNAIEEYRKLKILCETFPDDLSEEKTALLADAENLFNKIENLKKEFYTTKSAKSKSYIEEVVEKRGLDETDAEVLQKKITNIRNQLIESHKKIDSLLLNKDVPNAMREYSNLKNLSQSFPKEATEERVAILSEALAVFDRIKKVKENILKKKKQNQENEEQNQIEKQELDKSKKEIDYKITKIKQLLDSKKTPEAIAQFNELKQSLANISDDDYETKKSMYDEVLSAHLDMKILDQDHKSKLSTQTEEINKMNNIKKELYSLSKIIENKDNTKFDEATNLILELKHKTTMLSNDFFEEKYGFMKIIDELESKLIAVKTIDKITMQQNKLNGEAQ